MARWEANEDRILQSNADYFDSEAARYRELGDDYAANASQAAADKARSFIGDSGGPSGTDTPTSSVGSDPDSGGAAVADQAGQEDPAASAADQREPPATEHTQAGSNASENATAAAAEQSWMDEASAVELEDFRADAYKRLDDNLAIEQSSRLGGTIDDQAEARADAAASEVKRAQADIDQATDRINRLRYPR